MIEEMSALSRFLKNPLGGFSFLFTKNSAEDRVAAYVIREHDRGRSIGEILADPYVKNRVNQHEAARILERPDVLRAIGDEIAAEAKALLAEIR